MFVIFCVVAISRTRKISQVNFLGGGICIAGPEIHEIFLLWDQRSTKVLFAISNSLNF